MEDLRFDSRNGQIGTVSPTGCHRCDVFVFPRRCVVEIGSQAPLDDCRKSEIFLLNEPAVFRPELAEIAIMLSLFCPTF